MLSTTVLWSLPLASVYEADHARIPEPVWMAQGMLCPDSYDLVLVETTGQIRWRCAVPDGPSGSPLAIGDAGAACPGINNSLFIVDCEGQLKQRIALNAGITTPLVYGAGAIYFGIGVSQPYAVRVSLDSLKVDFQVPAAGKLTHPPALDQNGRLWLPTGEGMLLLDACTGSLLAQVPGRCISQVVTGASGAAVVMDDGEGSTLCQIDHAGQLIAAQAVQAIGARLSLTRAWLSDSWLVGTTVSSFDAANEDDITVAIGIRDAALPAVRVPAQRSLSVRQDARGLWLGGYTYDEDGERGGLWRIEDGGVQEVHSSLSAGCAAPLVDTQGRLYVLTADGLSCLTS